MDCSSVQREAGVGWAGLPGAGRGDASPLQRTGSGASSGWCSSRPQGRRTEPSGPGRPLLSRSGGQTSCGRASQESSSLGAGAGWADWRTARQADGRARWRRVAVGMGPLRDGGEGLGVTGVSNRAWDDGMAIPGGDGALPRSRSPTGSRPLRSQDSGEWVKSPWPGGHVLAASADLVSPSPGFQCGGCRVDGEMGSGMSVGTTGSEP